MAAPSNIIGTRFNLLTVLAHGATGYLCKCECGNEALVKRAYQLKNGNNKSCGCLMKATRDNIGNLNKTHGQSNGRVSGYKSRAYGIWQAMKDRCTNENRDDYHRYGGRGISVCDEWSTSFERFLKDMGEPPEKMTLERKNADGNYEPANCIWATRLEQSRNTANVKYICIDSETKPLWEWLEENKLNRGTYYGRLRAGWTVEEAILGKK